MSVACLKLVTGEEIIGELIQGGENYYTLKNVAAIMMMPSGAGNQVSLGLMPFLPYSEETSFMFSGDHVIVKHTPSTDLLNNYNRMFGSGIQIAKTIG